MEENKVVLNKFLNGVNSDIAEDLLPNGFLSNGHNIKFTNDDNRQGVVQKQESYIKELDGYGANLKPLAASSLDDVIYIVSFDTVNNLVEYGTYPSADLTGASVASNQHRTKVYKYAPLPNFNMQYLAVASPNYFNGVPASNITDSTVIVNTASGTADHFDVSAVGTLVEGNVIELAAGNALITDITGLTITLSTSIAFVFEEKIYIKSQLLSTITCTNNTAWIVDSHTAGLTFLSETAASGTSLSIIVPVNITYSPRMFYVYVRSVSGTATVPITITQAPREAASGTFSVHSITGAFGEQFPIDITYERGRYGRGWHIMFSPDPITNVDIANFTPNHGTRGTSIIADLNGAPSETGTYLLIDDYSDDVLDTLVATMNGPIPTTGSFLPTTITGANGDLFAVNVTYVAGDTGTGWHIVKSSGATSAIIFPATGSLSDEVLVTIEPTLGAGVYNLLEDLDNTVLSALAPLTITSTSATVLSGSFNRTSMTGANGTTATLHVNYHAGGPAAGWTIEKITGDNIVIFTPASGTTARDISIEFDSVTEKTSTYKLMNTATATQLGDTLSITVTPSLPSTGKFSIPSITAKKNTSRSVYVDFHPKDNASGWEILQTSGPSVCTFYPNHSLSIGTSEQLSQSVSITTSNLYSGTGTYILRDQVTHATLDTMTVIIANNAITSGSFSVDSITTSDIGVWNQIDVYINFNNNDTSGEWRILYESGDHVASFTPSSGTANNTTHITLNSHNDSGVYKLIDYPANTILDEITITTN